MEIDSVAAGGALKPDGDRFRRDEEPRFLIGEELSGLIPGAVRFTFPSLALSLHQTITFSISHRFRIFLLLQFLVVTVSQFTTFFQTTAYSGRITYINGGDFTVSRALVSSLVSCYTMMLKVWDGYVFRSLRWSKLLGLFCLHAATKISHRAQAIASVAMEFTWKPPRIHPSPFRIRYAIAE
ncbi:hypothetical protein YC2023_016786 [Brassica napus]